MKIVNVLHVFCISVSLIIGSISAVQKPNVAITEKGIFGLSMTNNDLLVSIVEKAGLLVNQIKSGKRDVAEKHNALKAIAATEKKLSTDVKALLQPYIDVIKDEIKLFFQHNRPLVKYDSREAENALNNLAGEVDTLIKNGSDDIVATAQSELDDILVETEKIKSAAMLAIAEINEQRNNGIITSVVASKRIARQKKIINDAENNLKIAAKKIAGIVIKSDKQTHFLSRYLAPFQAGYFSTEEEKEFARHYVAELQKSKRIETNPVIIEKLNDAIREQKIIMGEEWSLQRKSFWTMIGLIGALGLGWVAREYIVAGPSNQTLEEEQEKEQQRQEQQQKELKQQQKIQMQAALVDIEIEKSNEMQLLAKVDKDFTDYLGYLVQSEDNLFDKNMYAVLSKLSLADARQYMMNETSRELIRNKVVAMTHEEVARLRHEGQRRYAQEKVGQLFDATQKTLNQVKDWLLPKSSEEK